MKRPPRAGERPWDCLKGTSVICAPIHYILAYVESLDYRGEWDDLFVKGNSLDETELYSVECSCVTLLCGWLRKSRATSSAQPITSVLNSIVLRFHVFPRVSLHILCSDFLLVAWIVCLCRDWLDLNGVLLCCLVTWFAK